VLRDLDDLEQRSPHAAVMWLMPDTRSSAWRIPAIIASKWDAAAAFR
jgi:hypothetical protein